MACRSGLLERLRRVSSWIPVCDLRLVSCSGFQRVCNETVARSVALPRRWDGAIALRGRVPIDSIWISLAGGGTGGAMGIAGALGAALGRGGCTSLLLDAVDGGGCSGPCRRSC